MASLQDLPAPKATPATGHARTWGDLRSHQESVRDPFESGADHGLIAGREVVLRGVQPVHAAIDRNRDHVCRASDIGNLVRLGTQLIPAKADARDLDTSRADTPVLDRAHRPTLQARDATANRVRRRIASVPE
jgi:hypothetical protein